MYYVLNLTMHSCPTFATIKLQNFAAIRAFANALYSQNIEQLN